MEPLQPRGTLTRPKLEAPIRIGDAAERSGLSPDTIRYYERKGVSPKLPRGTDWQRRVPGDIQG
ncbi:MAG: MerR family DNA-binding transcriptional regulator [Pseudomonadota bacterium]